MNLKEKLPTPMEPVEIKRQINDFRSYFGSEENIDWDSQAVWFRNTIPTYLWNEWKVILINFGFTWPKFLKYMKYYTRDMIKWMKEKISWADFIQRLKESIEEFINQR
jgi:hypothetical protein